MGYTPLHNPVPGNGSGRGGPGAAGDGPPRTVVVYMFYPRSGPGLHQKGRPDARLATLYHGAVHFVLEEFNGISPRPWMDAQVVTLIPALHIHHPMAGQDAPALAIVLHYGDGRGTHEIHIDTEQGGPG